MARTDPVTGEKINKMRKSYEGQVKQLALAGRNKAVKHDPARPLGLVELARWPEEEWQNQKVAGKDIAHGLPDPMRAKLDKAMQMLPGVLPNSPEWEDVLGHEKAKPMAMAAEQLPKKSGPPPPPAGKVNGLTNGARPDGTKVPEPEIPRPKRIGKKRRYDEHSFEGYGEGYADDDVDIIGGGGYSSGDGSRKSGSSKKRRKVRTNEVHRR